MSGSRRCESTFKRDWKGGKALIRCIDFKPHVGLPHYSGSAHYSKSGDQLIRGTGGDTRDAGAVTWTDAQAVKG